MNKFVIGTRGSTLAFAQAEEIQGRLKGLFPKIAFELKTIRTGGDKTEKLLTRHAETVGFFTKELEETLLTREIDIAVHSLKDLPTKSPDALEIAAIPQRENPQDALVSKEGRPLAALKARARIGTGSSRRKSQLLHFNPSFEVVGVRGNLDTRVRKLEEGAYDALVLAMAGLRRIGIDSKKIWPIPFETMLPAPGQGALAVQIRRGEGEVNKMVSQLDHSLTRHCVTAERAFLSRLGGGCQLPLGAKAIVKEGRIFLEAVLMSEDGTKEIRSSLHSGEDPVKVGEALGEKFFEMGAEELLSDKR